MYKPGLIPIFPEFMPPRVKYKDVFDMKAFYEFCLREWLLENEWGDSAGDLDHWETLYSEKINRDGAKEIWIQWRPMKKAKDGKFTFYLDFNFHILGLISMEVVKEGMKIKTNKGEMELVIKAFIEKNYAKEFEKNWLLKNVLPLFENRIYKKEIEIRKKELYQEVQALLSVVKQWFKMKRYLPYEESKTFFTSQAWPSHTKEQ